MQLPAGGPTGACPGADDQVEAGELVLMQAEGFADDPADTITLDAAARGTHRDGKPETRPAFIVPERSHSKESISKAPPARVGGFEIRLTTQAPLRGECEPSWGRAVAGQAEPATE
jgi:hypothetical protein